MKITHTNSNGCIRLMLGDENILSGPDAEEWAQLIMTMLNHMPRARYVAARICDSVAVAEKIDTDGVDVIPNRNEVFR